MEGQVAGFKAKEKILIKLVAINEWKFFVNLE